MTRRMVQRPRAEQDIIDQAFHIHRDNTAAARRFVAAIDRTLAMLLDPAGDWRASTPRTH
jgi:plasmid stabilization system protein ParE